MPASKLEKAYIIWPSAGMLAAGVIYVGRTHLDCIYYIGRRLAHLQQGCNICRLTCLERWHYLMAVGGTLQQGAYMSADTLGACIYYMVFGWHACSGVHICGSAVMQRWPDQWWEAWDA